MRTKKISLFSLVLLIVAAIDSIRNLPSQALFGSSLIFFFLLSALCFLIPTALVSAELAATFPEKGGVYYWVHRAFGEKWAMTAIWLQWINTMVWYPTVLSFIAGTAAYLINPQLADNKWYLASIILIVFWSLTYANMRGVDASARFNSVCAFIGTVLPLTFLMLLGVFWIVQGHPLQISFQPQDLLPHLKDSGSWMSLIAIMASFLGMELSGVHVGDIENPQKNYPKAVLLSCIFLILTMLLGALAIAIVLPANQINLVSGVMQVFEAFFTKFHLQFLTPVLTLLIVIGTTGSITNWLISPAKGLLHAAEFGFLPPLFRRKNRHGTAGNILLAQAALVSILCSLFLFMPSINGFYWFLTALSTELYMLMYILMFFSLVALRKKQGPQEKIFRIPFKGFGLALVTLLGVFSCVATVVVSFLPPDNIDVGGPGRYVRLIGLGNLLSLAPLLLFFRYKAKD